ncbi:YifB family Mg chelatase-like AAA ATPase [bacterium]|nr:YifB family Mg chelatase-like AAA ATPase [bacterium]
MLASLNSTTLIGVTALPVRVEVDISNGLPRYSMVGLPDAGASESYERVWGALRNSGYQIPQGRITVNLAPGDIRKEGPHFDLSIALGILAAGASTQLSSQHLENLMVLGELSMAGEVRPVRGVLPSLITAKRIGIKRVIIPYANYQEASIFSGLEIIPVKQLQQACDYLVYPESQPPHQSEPAAESPGDYDIPLADSADLSMVCGQHLARRALEICAAGLHHLLFIGPPGSGPTLLARCLPSILPKLKREQALEVTAIHSTARQTALRQLVELPPFRAPSNNITLAGLLGSYTPGEVSQAHHGILFMDEFPEFRRECLEALRTPLECGRVEIARAKFSITYPCRFTLVAAMNPCHCGYFGDTERECLCTPGQREKYFHRISEPILDRIALQVRLSRPRPAELVSAELPEDSTSGAERVLQARRIQDERGCYNEHMTPQQIKRFCQYDRETERFLQQAAKHLILSARVFSSLARVSRTIADLKGQDAITLTDVSEALCYRSGTGRYSGEPGAGKMMDISVLRAY